jgi:hypothetical protein
MGGAAQTDINMTASGNVYSAVIPAQAANSVVVYKVSATNNLGETAATDEQNYTVGAAPSPPQVKLLILQVGSAHTSNGGAVTQNFIELYNAGDAAVPLSGYSLQYAAGAATTTGTDGTWTVIPLEGTIPPHCSFLVLGTAASPILTVGTTSNNTQYIIPSGSGDMNKTFAISNDAFKVALMNNTTQLAVQNPFNTGSGAKAPGYVDMVGAVNAGFIHGYETTACSKMSKQQTVRRTSLTDTDVNDNDFTNVDYRGNATAIGFRSPKNTAYGAWNPSTGVKE